ncbi:MAG: peptide chain release factor N(5)-glutamine methyltransferase [Bacilli bacterium]
MTANDAFRLYSQNKIPLADIKTVFDGVFSIPFDSLGIKGDVIIPDSLILSTLSKLRNGYPAVYLVGFDTIQGLRFFLSEDTLIPRIETIEFIYDYLANNFNLNGKKVLDLCTGSGFIALSVKKLFPQAIVTGSDISIKALAEARKSKEYNQLDVSLIQSDYFSKLAEKYDVIICNPPYIEENSKDVCAPFEPSLALFSGIDGMDSYRTIFKDLYKHLNSKGMAFFELEASNAIKTDSLFHSFYPKNFRQNY